MNTPIRKITTLTTALAICCSSAAFVFGQQERPAEEVAGASLENALRERSNIALSITEDSRSEAAKAIAALRQLDNPSGIPLEKQADFAMAAQDIAHRLLSHGKPAAAEEFFKAAENSLNASLQGDSAFTDDEKARMWANLADLRGTYLKMPEQAQEALLQAKELKPDDPKLKRLEQQLERRKGDKPQRGTPRG